MDRFRAEMGATVLAHPPEEMERIIENRSAPQPMPPEELYWDIHLLKEKLLPRDWMLLEGKYLIGLSDQELGRMYGCSKESVRMALTRAKQKARQILSYQNVEEGALNER